MDESGSIQASSSSCIKKTETTEVVSDKSNFEGSPQNICFALLFYSFQKKCGKISSECFADGWDIAKMVNLIRMEDIMYENEIQSIAARESDAEIYAGFISIYAKQ